jgi:hypothetical protein
MEKLNWKNITTQSCKAMVAVTPKWHYEVEEFDMLLPESEKSPDHFCALREPTEIEGSGHLEVHVTSFEEALRIANKWHAERYDE